LKIVSEIWFPKRKKQNPHSFGAVFYGFLQFAVAIGFSPAGRVF